MVLVLMCLVGVTLLVAPFAAPALGHPIGAGATLLSTITGAALLLVAGIMAVVTRLYQKTKASEAFVRTGAGGVKVIRDGGAIIVPFVHELIRVSLQTLKLNVSRDNEDALITQDKLRADVHAEFFVRVQPDKESILQASRSFGERMSDATAVKALVEDKLVSALRTAAASKTLEQLNSERDEFLTEVMKLVAEDLKNNGLVLETVTISRLDQTDGSFLKKENIFDAQGARKIAEITQQNLTERNRLLRNGEQLRKRQDVEAQEELLNLERKQSEVEAAQAAEVAKAKAEAERAAQQKKIDAERQVQLTEIERAKAVEVAARQQQQAIEVAEREAQEQIAEAERKRALMEQKLAEAEAERERARQAIETVKVEQDAERRKLHGIIDAQAQAEQQFVAEQRKADAEAYTRQKAADAMKAAADAEAVAIRKKAEAEAEAERQKASGEKARAMIPVEVQREQVSVDRDRIETVVKPELEAREKHGQVAQDFELAQLRISAEKEVRVALASASAQLFTKLEANLYGTPEDAQKILNSVLSGQSLASKLDGFFEAANDTTLGATQGALGAVGEIAKAVSERVANKAEPAKELPEAPPESSDSHELPEVTDEDIEEMPPLPNAG